MSAQVGYVGNRTRNETPWDEVREPVDPSLGASPDIPSLRNISINTYTGTGRGPMPFSY